MDDKIIIQIDNNSVIEETEKSIQNNMINIEEEEKKPLEERVSSKEWRVRKNAFLEVLEKLTSNIDDHPDYYSTYNFVYQKILDESNPNCQEHGVDILKILIEKYNLQESQKIEFFKQIIEKLCLSQKSQCKNKARELILYIYEHSRSHAALLENFRILLENKKRIVVVISSLDIIFLMLNEFGSAQFDYSILIPNIIKAYEFSNPAIRNWVLEIIKTLYKWIKEEIKPLLVSFKEIQLKEINSILTKLANTDGFNELKMIPKRILKYKNLSDKDERKPYETKVEPTVAKKGNTFEIKELKTENKESFFISILDKIFEKSELNLNEIINDELISHLDNKDTSIVDKKLIIDHITKNIHNRSLVFDQIDLINTKLKSLIKDANSTISHSTIMLITELSINLNRQFLGCKEYFPLICEKLKEKNDKMTKDIMICLDNIITYNNYFGEYVDLIENFIEDNSLSLKTALCNFLLLGIRKTYINTLKLFSFEVVELASRLTEDEYEEVKDIAIQCVSILKVRLGNNFSEKIYKEISEENRIKIEIEMNVMKYDKMYDDKEFFEPEINLSEKKRRKEVELLISQRKNREISTKSKSKLININYDSNKKSEVHELKLDAENDIKKNYETVQTNKTNLIIFNDKIEVFDEKREKLKNLENAPDVVEKIEIDKVAFDDRPISHKVDIDKLPFDERPIGYKNKSTMGMNLDEFPPEDDEYIKQQNDKKAKLNNNKKSHVNQKYSNNSNNPIDNKDQTSKIEEPTQIIDSNEGINTKTTVIKKNEKPKQAKPDSKTPEAKGLKEKEDEDDTKLSKEEIDEKINNLMENLDLKTQFSSSKWEDRKKAFSDMNEFIKENPDKVKDMSEHLILYIKYKLKDWKEGNFNINKEAIQTLTQIITITKGLDKKLGRNIIKGFHERLSDNKVKENIINLYLLLMEHLTPSYSLNILLTLLKNSKSPSLLKDYAIFIEKSITEFGINSIPVKEVVEFCKNLANHTNPQVRSSATSLLCELYKYIGKDLMILLKDIKESTLKLIEESFNEVKIFTNKNDIEKPKRVVKAIVLSTTQINSHVKIKNNNINENSNLLNIELFPRVDISKKIIPKFLKDINNGKWNEKKEAIESMERVLIDANNRILPTGLNDLFVAIKSKLGDGNKNFVRLLVAFLTKLIDALGNPFKNFAKNLSTSLISILADKQLALRDDVVICIDKWINKVEFPNVVIYFPNYLKQDNFEMRTELLKIIIKNKDSFIKCDLKEFVNPLLLCLQDKTISIRTVAEETIFFTLKNLSLNSYYNSLKDFKPAIVNSIKPILDKFRIAGEESQNTGRANDRKISSTDKINVYDDEKQMTTSPSQKKIGSKLLKDKVSGISKKPPNGLAHSRENNKTPTNLDEHINYGTNSGHKSNSPKSFSTYTASIFININNSKQLKEKRLEMDKKIKFNIDNLTDDMNIKLKDQVKNFILIDVVDKMFSEDLKTNIETFATLQNSLKNENSLFFDSFDMILKWLFFKSSTQQNPIFIKALIEFFECVLNYITEKEYKLSDFESMIIVATLIDKFSVAKLKENLKSIIEKYETAVSAYRMFSLLLSCSINKNPKIKCECLDICSNLIIKHGVGTASFKDIKSIAKILESNDNSLKNSALYLLVEAYKQLNDNFWSILNDIPDKSKDLLEAKINLINMEEASLNSKKGINRSTIVQNKPKLDKNKDKSFDNDVELKNNTSFDVKKIDNTSSQNLISKSPKKSRELEQNPSNEDMSKLKGNLDLLSYLSILENGEAKERVNILIILNDLISSTKTDNSRTILSINLDLIIKTFINCLQSSFDKSINEIPIKFGKYLLTVLYKICCLKELIFKISYKVLFELCEEVLSKLLIDNLDKIGENQEGKIILKSLNGTMLRVLENCSPTDIFSVLIELVRKYRTSATTPRIAGLAIKCLLKLTQIINQIINDINIETILVKIHEFIADMEQTNPDLNPKHQNDELSLRIIKTIINELVKIKKEEINDIYNKTVEKHRIKEIQIKKWISIILKSISVSNNETPNNLPNKSALPKESIILLEELTKLSYDNLELNSSKIQILFSMFAKVNFDFTRLNNVIDSKLYQKLFPLWDSFINTDKNKLDMSPSKKYNNIDNLIEYKNKLQEITKQYKQQQNITYDKDKLKITDDQLSSPKRNIPNAKKELQNTEVYNKITNLKSKLTNYNDKQNNLNKTSQDEVEPKNAYNKMNDLKKKLKDISSNNTNQLSTSNLQNLGDDPSSEVGSLTRNTPGLNSYQNDTLSKLSEIKNKLNTFKKNSVNNANNK